jgi:hypothetical protein
MRGGNARPGTQPAAIPVPTTPTLQDQMVYDIVDAVQQAYENLQNLQPCWNWMRGQTTITLPNGQRTITRAVIRVTTTDYERLITLDAGAPPFVNVYDGAAAVRTDYKVWYIEYENWRGWRDSRPLAAPGQPTYITEWPMDYTLEVDPTTKITPNGGSWTIACDYRKTNQTLINSADVLLLPSRFNELLVWMAVLQICETRNSTGFLMDLAQTEIYGDGRHRQGRLHQLEIDQLPNILIDTRYAGNTW